MRGCDRFGEELSAYRDGELERDLARQLEAHLPECADCRNGLEALARLERGLAALPRIEPSPGFEHRLRLRLERGRPPAPRRRPRWGALEETFRRRPWLPGGMVAAAGVAMALLIYTTLGRTPTAVDPDWALAADQDGFELVLAEDPELLAALDLLETWDGSGEL